MGGPYKKETGVGLNYQSIGSGGGIKQIQAKTVTFGATDAPLKGAGARKVRPRAVSDGDGRHRAGSEYRRNRAGRIWCLTARRLRGIFLGTVKTWDDPAIKKLNPDAKLPSQAIAVVHRSDGSGTTFNFTYYLAEVSADWKSKVGSATSVEWPVGIGAKGNEGVSNNVSQTKGSIGYVEYAYALQNKLDLHQNGEQGRQDGSPTSAAFQAAAANADWNSVPGYGVILANQPGAESWPMTAATFILIHKQPPDPAAAAEALKFFGWAYDKGDKMAEELDYVPMPDKVVGEVEKVWASQIKDAGGKPLYAEGSMAH